MNKKDTPGKGDLELDFNDLEIKKAQVPLEPDSNKSPESTFPLIEVPLPSGVSLGSRTILEPILSKVDDSVADQQSDRFLAPSFLIRLSSDSEPEGREGQSGEGQPTEDQSREGQPTEGQSRVEKVANQTWSISNGQQWPVFIKRFHLNNPIEASTLKKLALAVKRYGDNRLSLGSNGYFDVFFNDRTLLEQFSQEIDEKLLPAKSLTQINIAYCSGLLACPMAAVDTLTAAEKLEEILSGHFWSNTPSRRLPLTLTIAGCQVGQGLDCGIYEYCDLTLVGSRDSYPVIDQKLASLSEKISLLITDCPGQAINRGHAAGATIEINPKRCLRCGWCVKEDPAFSWPTPQKSYFSLEISGRRTYPPYDFIPPKTLCPKLPNDWIDIGLKLIKLIEFWRLEAKNGEILADFISRQGIENL
jgi:dissimilatory sulfite reductase (desulfoviridin) alpha/beta subunit